MLREGTDMKYGARHLKRAIERLLVQPMSNLMATDQVRGGDWVKIDFDETSRQLAFIKEAEGLPIHAMADLLDDPLTMPLLAQAAAAVPEPVKTQTAKSSKRS